MQVHFLLVITANMSVCGREFPTTGKGESTEIVKFAHGRAFIVAQRGIKALKSQANFLRLMQGFECIFRNSP